MSGILKTLYTPRPSTWTFNAWVKRSSTLNTNQSTINNCYIFGASDAFSVTNGKGIAFITSQSNGSSVDEIGYYDTDNPSDPWGQVNSLNNNVLRDFDGWYNIHVQCTGNVANLYVNGVMTHQNLNINITNSTTLNIGNLGWVIDGESYSLNGQMQEVHFVDGQSLAYSVFIENTPLQNNSLAPKEPNGIIAAIDSTGGYGLNGFYWDFATPQTMGLEYQDLAGKQWKSRPDSVSAVFNTGFVRTGASARTENNSSLYFSGSSWTPGAGGGLITFEGDIFNPGTKNLTIESWVYFLQNNSGYIFDTRYSTFTSNPALYLNETNNTFSLFVNGTTIGTYTVGSGVVDGNWHHIAVTYSEKSSVWKMYWDGSEVISATSDWAQQSSKLLLGTRYSLDDTYTNKMFVEGFRYTDKLLYGNNFTPPTSTLTSGSNTKLLILQDSTLNDNSSSAHTITETNVTSNTSIVPFSGATSYYFDGTSSEISIPTSDDWSIGTTNYTIEAYIKTNDAVGEIISAFNSVTPFTGFLFGIGFGGNNGKLAFFGADVSTSLTVTSGARVDDNIWHHVAVSYVDGSVSFWIDGVLDSTHTFNIDPGNSQQTIYIGRDANSSPSRYYKGYISNLRVTKGSAITTNGGVYTSSANGNFTPGPIDSIKQYTIDGGSTYRNINGKVHSCLNSNSKDAALNKGSQPKYQLRPFVGSTRQTTGGAGAGTPIYHSGMCGESRYGKSSYHVRSCTAITDYGSEWDLSGNIDFTFETWIKLNGTPGDGKGYISIETGTGSTYYSYESLLLFGGASGTLVIYASNTANGPWNIFSGNAVATPVLGQWHHFAYCRSSSDGMVRVYWDGVQVQSATAQLGSFPNPALLLNGRWNTTYTSTTDACFDGIRLIKGQNIYPSGTSFTPGRTSSTTQYTVNGGSSFSSITGTVPFCLDDQRSTITEDKSSSSLNNGGIFYKPVVEIGNSQNNIEPEVTVSHGDSSKNKFLKFNPVTTGLHESGIPLSVSQSGLSVAAGQSNGSNNFNTIWGNFGVTTGKYYFEFKTYKQSGDNNLSYVGIQLLGRYRFGNSSPTSRPGSYGIQVDSYSVGTGGVKTWYNENALSTDIAHTSPNSGGDIFGIAWDVDNHRLYIHQNGNWLNSANVEDPSSANVNLGSIDPLNPSSNVYFGDDIWGFWNGSYNENGIVGDPKLGWTVAASVTTSADNNNKSGILMNFGQGTTGNNYSDEKGRGKFRYEPPAGFLSLCTSNKDENEQLNAAAKNPDAYMGVIEYTANGSNQSITGLGFKPDLLIGLQKNDTVGYYTGVMDSVRGNGRLWTPQSASLVHSDLQYSDQIVSFDDDGFTVGNNTSGGNYLSLSGKTYVAYCWKAGGPIGAGADKYKRNGSTFVPEPSSMTINGISCNTDSGFSIINYQGDTGVYSYVNAVTSMTNSADNLSLGTGDWTVEFWFYTNNTTQQAEIVNKGLPFQIYQNQTSLQFYASSNGSTYDIASGANFLTNTQGQTRPFGINRWHHVAIVRSKTNGTYKGWLNGRLSFTINSNLDIAQTSAVWKFGAYNNSTDNTSLVYQFSGYLSDLNVWRGTAQYNNDVIDIVKPSWTNGGSATTISDFKKSTTNLLMAVSFRNSNSLFAVSGISGLDGNFTQSSASVTYNSSARPPGFVPHGLSGRPSLAMIKSTTNDGGGSGATPIMIYQGLSDYIPVLGETHFCVNGYQDNSYFLNGVSVPSYSLDSQVNDELRNYTVYLWQSIPGYSSIGMHNAFPNDNSSAINVGFRPKFVMLLHAAGNPGTHAIHWFDTTTTTPNNGVYNRTMWPITAGSNQPTGTNNFHITSTGWECINADSEPYIAGTDLSSQMVYMAFAEQPFSYANAR